MVSVIAVGSHVFAMIENMTEVKAEVMVEDVSEAISRALYEEPEAVLLEAGSTRAWVSDLARIRGALKEIPILVVIDSDEPSAHARALEAGASGLLLKPLNEEAIVTALQVIRAGGSYIGEVEALDLVEAIRARDGVVTPHLTSREIEVLTHLAEGRSARQIASRLAVSERTINTHVANLYRKMGVSNRVEAVREGIRLGLVSPP